MASPRSVVTIQRAALPVPFEPGHLGLETGIAIEVEMPGYPLAMPMNLGRLRIFARWHVAKFLQHRQVHIAFGIACRAWVAVPVPDPAEVPATVDEADVFEAGFAHVRSRQQSAKTAPDHGDIDFVAQRVSRMGRFGVRVLPHPGEIALHRDELADPSGRKRLSRSARYLARRAAGSIPSSASIVFSAPSVIAGPAPASPYHRNALIRRPSPARLRARGR